jgi:hypothetical protein
MIASKQLFSNYLTIWSYWKRRYVHQQTNLSLIETQLTSLEWGGHSVFNLLNHTGYYTLKAFHRNLNLCLSVSYGSHNK